MVASLHFFLRLFLTCRSMNNLISEIYFVKNRYLIIISKNYDQLSEYFNQIGSLVNIDSFMRQHFICEKP